MSLNPASVPAALKRSEDEIATLRAEVAKLRSLLGRARPHVDAPLGTLAADIDLALGRRSLGEGS